MSVRTDIDLPKLDLAVLTAVHDAPWIDPDKQNAVVREALKRLEALGLLGPSCLNVHALESTEDGARLLGYA